MAYKCAHVLQLEALPRRPPWFDSKRCFHRTPPHNNANKLENLWMRHSRVMDAPLFLKFKYKSPNLLQSNHGSLIYLGCCRVALQTFKNLERQRMRGEGGRARGWRERERGGERGREGARLPLRLPAHPAPAPQAGFPEGWGRGREGGRGFCPEQPRTQSIRLSPDMANLHVSLLV